MTFKTRLFRLLIGLIVLAGLLVGLFAVTLPAIHRWGATDAEVASTLPGDGLIELPLVRWTHGQTINAPLETVWPWIAQIGDARGGYYSYTFIENQVGALTGAADYKVVYTNADRIHPEWQNPQPGDSMIQSVLKVRAVEPGKYLLADSLDPAVMNWIWLWYLQPIADGQQTRLIVRFGIDVGNGPSDPVMGFLMDVGGFVMEQNMLQGIKLRAEGGFEPTWIEPVEIALWVIALLIGLIGAILFLWRRAWILSFTVALVAVVAIFILTFVQPPVWSRAVIDGVLLVGLVQSWRTAGQTSQVSRGKPVLKMATS